jgi:hypothetical protein
MQLSRHVFNRHWPRSQIFLARDIVASDQDGVINLSGMAWSDDDIRTAPRVSGSVPDGKGANDQIGLKSVSWDAEAQSALPRAAPTHVTLRRSPDMFLAFGDSALCGHDGRYRRYAEGGTRMDGLRRTQRSAEHS